MVGWYSPGRSKQRSRAATESGRWSFLNIKIWDAKFHGLNHSITPTCQPPLWRRSHQIHHVSARPPGRAAAGCPGAAVDRRRGGGHERVQAPAPDWIRLVAVGAALSAGLGPPGLTPGRFCTLLHVVLVLTFAPRQGTPNDDRCLL